MKSRNLTCTLFAAALFLTGCWQKSVYPFYQESDLIFDGALIGEWREVKDNPDEGAKWSFAKGETEKTYRVRLEDGDIKLECDGRLFKLGGNRFLDLHSRARSITEIPAHHLFRITQVSPSIKIQILNIDWIRDWLRANPKDISHVTAIDPEHPNESDKTEYILTAVTERLQKFVLDHANDPEFFGELMELKPQRK